MNDADRDPLLDWAIFAALLTILLVITASLLASARFLGAGLVMLVVTSALAVAVVHRDRHH